MKSGPFLSMIADTFSVEGKTVTVYARALKEAGLLTTGARGVNAPDMTPLDAARMTIALLACDGPSQAVERVQRFGKIRYSPDYRTSQTWRETIGPEEFASLFPVETLEEVLAFIYSLYLDRSLEDASRWFNERLFSLKILPFEVSAELELWKYTDNKITGERVIPFRGTRRDPQYTTIKGGIRVERAASPGTLSEIAIRLWAADRKEAR